MTPTESFTVRRLSNLDEWEFYKLVPTGKADAALTIGLRPYIEFWQVEYEVWDEHAEEPQLAGSVPCEEVGERWFEAAREPILNEIVRNMYSKP